MSQAEAVDNLPKVDGNDACLMTDHTHQSIIEESPDPTALRVEEPTGEASIEQPPSEHAESSVSLSVNNQEALFRTTFTLSQKGPVRLEKTMVRKTEENQTLDEIIDKRLQKI